MMRLATTLAFTVLIAVLPASAQQTRIKASQHSRSVHHLLSRERGQAVVETALHTRPWDYYASDCSHFVNAIFEAVGLPFPYLNSIALYKGSHEFRRVFHPQPGDLIVWRGHVGIVVDPEQHTFYSMLKSGLRLASYDTRYWRRRGPFRFLRYAANKIRPARRNTVTVTRLRSEGR